MGEIYFILIKKHFKTDGRKKLQNKTKLSMFSYGTQIEIDERKIEICQLNVGGYTFIDVRKCLLKCYSRVKYRYSGNN